MFSMMRNIMIQSNLNRLPSRFDFRQKSLIKLLGINAIFIQLPSALHSIFYMKSEKYFDIAGFGSFSFLVASSIFCYKPNYLLWSTFIDFRKFILFWFINVWIYRLSMQSMHRIQRNGDRDSRFDTIRDNKLLFLGAYILQTIWISVVISPALMLFANSPVHYKTNFDTLFTGTYMMIKGFAIETMADLQKDRFKSIDINKDKFIDFGLWHYIEYPNYLGEIMFWTGASIICSPNLKNIGPWAKILGILSPLYTWFQLTFISGVNLQRKIAEKRWGNQEEYWSYRRRVGMYWPRLSNLSSFFEK